MITNGSFRKVFIASIPTGPAIADTGSLEVSFPQIRVISATEGQSYIWLNSGSLEFVNRGWLKFYIQVTGQSYIESSSNDMLIGDTTGTVYTFSNAEKIVHSTGELRLLDASDNITNTF